MDKQQHQQIIDQHIQNAIDSMFPHGEGRIGRARVEHHLHQVGQYAFTEGRNYALLNLMTVIDVAEHFGISPRRARALIQNRHQRFGIGMRIGRSWLIHRDELDELAPAEKYRST